MTPELQKLFLEAVFRGVVIAGIAAATIAALTSIFNGWRDRCAAEKKLSEELASAERRHQQTQETEIEKLRFELSSAEKRHRESQEAELKKVNLELASERRQQAQSLAIQLALETWKADHAFAIKLRDTVMAHDAKMGVHRGSYDLEDIGDLPHIEAVVRRMVHLTRTICEKDDRGLAKMSEDSQTPTDPA